MGEWSGNKINIHNRMSEEEYPESKECGETSIK